MCSDEERQRTGKPEVIESSVPEGLNARQVRWDARGRGLFLEDLFVRVQFRSRRVGDALLSRVLAIARNQGFFGMVFNALAWNQPPAIRFFEKHHAMIGRRLF